MISILVIGSLRSPPLSGFAIGHTCGVKVQRVQRVQKVQRVVVAADAADYKKGRGSAAGCIKGLHRFTQGAVRNPEGAVSRLSPLTFQRQSQENHFHTKNPAAGNCRI